MHFGTYIEAVKGYRLFYGAGYPQARILLPPEEGEMVRFGGLGVRFMIDGLQTGGTFALVEHPIEPRVLAAPMHTPVNYPPHQRERQTGEQPGA